MIQAKSGDWPVAERPRERMRALGPQGLATRELLAIVIGSGSGSRPASQTAGELLSIAHGSLRRLASLSPAELERTPGVGPANAARIAAALELGRRLARERSGERLRVRSGADVYARCSPSMRDLVQEEFRILLLDTKRAVRRDAVVTRGVLDGSLVHAREVYRLAITENASAIIVVHNHPSGDPTPSPDDDAITAQLYAAGEVIGIAMLDHVIIGDGRYYSFGEAGRL